MSDTPFGPYSKEFIKGKAAKVAPGKIQLFIMSDGSHVVGIPRHVDDKTEYSSSVWITSDYSGFTPVGLYYWFAQPTMVCRTIREVFTLESDNLADARKEAEQLISMVNSFIIHKRITREIKKMKNKKLKNRYKKLYQIAVECDMPMAEIPSLKKSLADMDFYIRVSRNKNRVCYVTEHVTPGPGKLSFQKDRTEHVYKSPKGVNHVLCISYTFDRDLYMEISPEGNV